MKAPTGLTVATMKRASLSISNLQAIERNSKSKRLIFYQRNTTESSKRMKMLPIRTSLYSALPSWMNPCLTWVTLTLEGRNRKYRLSNIGLGGRRKISQII